eukprot:gene31164-6305_t
MSDRCGLDDKEQVETMCGNESALLEAVGEAHGGVHQVLGRLRDMSDEVQHLHTLVARNEELMEMVADLHKLKIPAGSKALENNVSASTRSHTKAETRPSSVSHPQDRPKSSRARKVVWEKESAASEAGVEASMLDEKLDHRLGQMESELSALIQSEEEEEENSEEEDDEDGDEEEEEGGDEAENSGGYRLSKPRRFVERMPKPKAPEIHAGLVFWKP